MGRSNVLTEEVAEGQAIFEKVFKILFVIFGGKYDGVEDEGMIKNHFRLRTSLLIPNRLEDCLLDTGVVAEVSKHLCFSSIGGFRGAREMLVGGTSSEGVHDDSCRNLQEGKEGNSLRRVDAGGMEVMNYVPSTDARGEVRT